MPSCKLQLCKFLFFQTISLFCTFYCRQSQLSSFLFLAWQSGLNVAFRYMTTIFAREEKSVREGREREREGEEREGREGGESKGREESVKVGRRE